MSITLRPMPAKFFRTALTFHPATDVISPLGGSKPTYSGPGVTVNGVVQPRSVRREEPSGVICSYIVNDVFLRMDAYLSLGFTVAADDHITTPDGRTLGVVGGMRDRGGRGLVAEIEAVEIVF